MRSQHSVARKFCTVRCLSRLYLRRIIQTKGLEGPTAACVLLFSNRYKSTIRIPLVASRAMDVLHSAEAKIGLSPSPDAGSSNSHIKGTKISARWDGIQGHPAAVSINYIVINCSACPLKANALRSRLGQGLAQGWSVPEILQSIHKRYTRQFTNGLNTIRWFQRMSKGVLGI